MDLILFGSTLDAPAESLEDFLDALRSRRMKYLASALLEQGFEPKDIVEALRRAMAACRAAGYEVGEHFKPVYSSYRGSLVRDCKLTRMGYMLTVINGRPDLELTAKWQSRLLMELLGEN